MTAAAMGPLEREGWKDASLIFVVSLIALAIANGGALWALLRLWAFSGHAYGFAVAAISGWLIWKERKRVLASAPKPSWRALLLMVPLGAAIWAAYFVDVRLAQLALFIASVGLLVWVILGFAVFRIVAYPIALLALALPIWNYFQPVLQDLTVRATEFAIRNVGVPVFVDDTVISIPQGTIQVSSGCSGAQYFQAGLTLGAMYAYMSLRSMWARVITIVSFVAMAVVGNWARVLVLVFLDRLGDLEHLGVGWMVFAGLLVPTFAFTMWLQRRERQVLPDAASSVTSSSSSQMIVVAVAAVTLLVSGPLAQRAFAASGDEENWRFAPIAVRLPWTGPSHPFSDWRPAFYRPQAESLDAYSAAGREVTVYRAYYAVQRQGREVVNELNEVFDSSRWAVKDGHVGTVYRMTTVGSNDAFRVIETRLQRRGTREERLVWHWYDVAGENVADAWHAKLEQIAGIFHGRRDAMIIAVSTDARSIDDARALLTGFVASNYESMQVVKRDRTFGPDGAR